MSARKSRFISKILAGVVTTIVAPVLASVVGQQVDDWQHTLKVLVENEPPAAKANWNLPVPEVVGVGSNRFTAENAENAENAEKSKTIPHYLPLRSPRSSR
jgi:hypothetical protein